MAAKKKAIDFKDEPIISTSSVETEGIPELKKVMKHIPELVESIIPDIKNVKLQQPEAIFLMNIKNSLVWDLRKNEKKIAKFMKEQGDGYIWDAEDDIAAVEKLLEVAAIIIESDNYPRSIWTNFLIKMWAFYESNRITHLRKYPGRSYLQDFINEQQESTHRIAEFWVKEKTGRDVEVAFGDRKNFEVKEVKSNG